VRSRQAQAAREKLAHDAATNPQPEQQEQQSQRQQQPQDQQQPHQQHTLQEMWVNRPVPSIPVPSAFDSENAMETELNVATATHVARARAILAEADQHDATLLNEARDFLARVAEQGDNVQ
jgi:predicted membrane metal-binding protein